MHRIVHHHGYPRRGFSEICELFARGGSEPLAEATRAGAGFADVIADEVRGLSESFDVDEDVKVEVAPLRRHHDSASLDISWIADPTKRLLPDVNANLEINPILPEGPPRHFGVPVARRLRPARRAPSGRSRVLPRAKGRQRGPARLPGQPRDRRRGTHRIGSAIMETDQARRY
jgi:hypothetical protein